MGSVLILGLTLAVGLLLAPAATAMPCFGDTKSCFAPLFVEAGEVAKYKGGGEGVITADAAACCTVGDTYKVVLKKKGVPGREKVRFTSEEGVDAGCFVGAHPGTHSISLNGANVAKVKAIELAPGPGHAVYLTLTGEWRQVRGVDSCGW